MAQKNRVLKIRLLAGDNSETRKSFIALENKTDQRFDRSNDKSARALEKV